MSPAERAWTALLAVVAIGATFSTNALGGHSVPLALVSCGTLLVLAVRRRQGIAVDVGLAAAVALVSLPVFAALS